MKIVVLDGSTLNNGDLSWDGFRDIGELTVYDRTAPEDTISRIGDAPIVITNKTVISKEILDACPNVKYIGVLATGYNVVDVEAATNKNIPVKNVPGYSTDTVAQFTIGLMLELCNKIGVHDVAVKNREWTTCQDFCFWKSPLIDLKGKTLGIIGFGSIGQRVAEIAKALGMNILVYSRTIKKELEDDKCKFVELGKLYQHSDIISLHCPLFQETTGIINNESISKMKDGVMIINTARGGCIVESDLRNALDSKKVSGAAVDVVSVEPMREDNPLLDATNIIITPHIAWASKEARERLMNQSVFNLKDYLQSHDLTNAVNKDELTK